MRDCLCLRYLGVIFHPSGTICAQNIRGYFSPKCPRYSGMTFSPEWDHRSPRYLGVIFHPSGTICDQNVRFYLETTNIVERLFCQFVVFPRFLISLLLLTYIFSLTCYFLLACQFSPTWDHLCPRYLGMIFSREWDHLCPRYLGLIFHPSGTICAQDV